MAKPAKRHIFYSSIAPQTPSSRWPSTPRRLLDTRLSSVLSFLVDIILLLFASAFAGLAVAAASLHRKPIAESSIGRHVENACKLGPTLYPILFAALVGRSLKVVGRYWVGRGVDLGTLETITASQSVWSTIETQLQLRAGSIVGLLLLALWSLAPLGGQASLRVLQRDEMITNTVLPLQYMSTGPAAAMFASGLAGGATTVRPPERVVMLSRRVMARHADVFGGVKIPRFEALTAPADAGGWKTVPRVLQPEDFTSLIGLRVVGLSQPPNNDDAETHFRLESSYLSADCQPFVALPYPSNINNNHNNYNRPRAAAVEGMARRMGFNFSDAVARREMPGERIPARGAYRPFFFDLDREGSLGRNAAFLGLDAYLATPLPRDDADIARQRRVVFGARYVRTESNGQRSELINMANCTLRQTHVEAAVVCPPRNSHGGGVGGGDGGGGGGGGGGGCRARRMRLSLTDRRPPSVTFFDGPLMAGRFLRMLAMVYTSGTSNSSSQMERFLVGGRSDYATLPRKVEDPYEFVDVASVPLEVVNRRLSLVLNTLFMALVMRNHPDLSRLARYQNASTSIRDDLAMFVSRSPPQAPPSTSSSSSSTGSTAPANASAIRLIDSVFSAMGRAAADGLPFIPVATAATATVRTPIYVCAWAWLATLLASAAALLAAGAAALALQLRCALAPDALRYAASLTYANRHVGAPPGGTALGGFERARLLGGMRVQIGDVCGGDEVGEVAFVATKDVEVRELEATRLYR